MANFGRVKVEPVFDAAVTAAGGLVVRNGLGGSPSFENADYLFRAEQVVGELKCLTQETGADPAVHTKLSAKYRNRCGRVAHRYQ